MLGDNWLGGGVWWAAGGMPGWDIGVGFFGGGVGHCGGVGRGWAVQGGFNICFCVIFCFLALHSSIFSIFPNIVSLKLFKN